MIFVFLAIIGAAILLWSMSHRVSNIAQYARNAGFSGPDLVTAVAIALAESGGDPEAFGDRELAPDKGPSVGLWQIDVDTHPEYENVNLTDPQVNANAAFAV